MADVSSSYHGGDGDNSPPRDGASQLSSGCESSQPARRGRGRNKKFFEKVAKRPKDSPRCDVHIDMTGGQYKFIGEHGRDFISLLSNQVRSVVPFHYHGWSHVPREMKRAVYPVLYDYFNLEKWETHEEWDSIKCAINAECSRAFSDWKFDLGQHFQECGGYGDLETALATPPEHYGEENWALLVKHFCTEKYRKRSEANKKNRSKQKYPSLHGSKSLASRRHEGKNSMEIFHDTHTKDGKFQHPLAEEDYGKLQDVFAEAAGEDGDQEVNDVECLKQTFGDTRGFVRGYGRVVRQPTPFLPDTRPHPVPAEWQQQLQNLQEQQQKEAAERAQREAEQQQIIQEMQRQLQQQQEMMNFWMQQYPRPPPSPDRH